MHEAGLINDLIRKIEQLAASEGALRVSRVYVNLGALSHISPEHFDEHFRIASAGSICDGAALQIEASTDLGDPNAESILITGVDVEL